MNAIDQERKDYNKRLRNSIRSLLRDQLNEMTPWWFVSFHYRDNHTDEQKMLAVVLKKEKLRDLEGVVRRFLATSLIAS